LAVVTVREQLVKIITRGVRGEGRIGLALGLGVTQDSKLELRTQNLNSRLKADRTSGFGEL
jgi:hypothetical protein